MEIILMNLLLTDSELLQGQQVSQSGHREDTFELKRRFERSLRD
jgi:hypothetical protein